MILPSSKEKQNVDQNSAKIGQTFILKQVETLCKHFLSKVKVHGSSKKPKADLV